MSKYQIFTSWFLLQFCEDLFVWFGLALWHINHFRLFHAKSSKYLYIFTNPSAQAGYDTKSIFKQSLTGLNSEFSFSYIGCHTKAEEHSLTYYLPIAEGRIIGFIPFPRVLVLCEMQSVSKYIYIKWWCNCYRRRKWTRWHEFKSWTRLIAFHIALIPLGKVWIQLFSLQLWVNSRTD